jgi:hypothetical protein
VGTSTQLPPNSVHQVVPDCPGLQRTEGSILSNYPRMPPTLAHLPLPQPSDENFVHIIPNLLSPAECETIIQAHTASLIPHELTLTTRLRKIFDDEELAETLWSRLKPVYGDMKVVDEDRCSWTASRLNTRFRFAKYERGWSFHLTITLLAKRPDIMHISRWRIRAAHRRPPP